jgi:hypothetical protein
LIESGFREELFDDTQLIKDFWLYSIYEELDKTIITKEEKVIQLNRDYDCVGGAELGKTAVRGVLKSRTGDIKFGSGSSSLYTGSNRFA